MRYKVLFFEVEKMGKSTEVFNFWTKLNSKFTRIFYSYFRVDERYYLCVFSKDSLDDYFIRERQDVKIIRHLDRRKQYIRSYRGYLLYALDIMKEGKKTEILKTNLSGSFWEEVSKIIRLHRKGRLQTFLFGPVDFFEQSVLNDIEGLSRSMSLLEAKTERIDFLEKRMEDLEKYVDERISQEIPKSSEVSSDGSRKAEKGVSVPNGSNPTNPTVEVKKRLLNESPQKKLPNALSAEFSSSQNKNQENSKPPEELSSIVAEKRISSKESIVESSVPVKDKSSANSIWKKDYRGWGNKIRRELFKKAIRLLKEGDIDRFEDYFEGEGEHSLYQEKGVKMKFRPLVTEKKQFRMLYDKWDKWKNEVNP